VEGTRYCIIVSQAGMQNQPANAAKKDFMAVLKETVTPAYSSRCWLSLFTKNVMANTPLCVRPPLTSHRKRARNNNAAGPNRTYARSLNTFDSSCLNRKRRAVE